MEGCIPVPPSNYGASFFIFRWGGQGYFPRPGGPVAPFIHRESDELVPRKEISAALRFLGMDEAIFWQMEADCQLNRPSAAPAQESRNEGK
jgi:hypothetical protein